MQSSATPAALGSTSEMRPLVGGQSENDLGVDRDARAFLIARHNKHGYLVLNAFKERKGQHGQLPGGRIDLGENGAVASVRELFEETGILVTTDRIKYLWPIGNKHFYYVELNDNDQVKGGQLSHSGEQFRLKLSDEHISFSFYKDIHAAAKAVLRHSGGAPANALEKYASELENEA